MFVLFYTDYIIYDIKGFCVFLQFFFSEME